MIKAIQYLFTIIQLQENTIFLHRVQVTVSLISNGYNKLQHLEHTLGKQKNIRKINYMVHGIFRSCPITDFPTLHLGLDFSPTPN